MDAAVAQYGRWISPGQSLWLNGESHDTQGQSVLGSNPGCRDPSDGERPSNQESQRLLRFALYRGAVGLRPLDKNKEIFLTKCASNPTRGNSFSPKSEPGLAPGVDQPPATKRARTLLFTFSSAEDKRFLQSLSQNPENNFYGGDKNLMENTQTCQSDFYSTPTRVGVFRKLENQETRVSDIAENLTVGKGAVHYQLQNLVDEGAAVQIQDEYMLKKDAYKKKRRMQQKMQDFKHKLERMLAYKPNMGRFWKRYQKFQSQKQRFEAMGVQCPSFGPEQIVQSKKETVENVLRRTDRGRSSRKHRKFEQMQEFKLICTFVEEKMGFELTKGQKSISLENPIGVRRLESALA